VSISFADRVLNSLRRRIKYNFHPRALAWKYWKKHCPTKSVITSLGTDLKVRVYVHDVIGEHIYVDGCFEPYSWNFVRGFLKEGMVVFDLGANLGQYTLLAAQIVGETGGVHSFEPGSRMFDELKFNVFLNGLSRRCVLNNVAVSDVSGVANLSKYAPGSEVYSSLGSHARREATVIGHEEVRTVMLDDYVKNAGIFRVDFMKIDIEGAELPALRGAENLLSGSEAPVILIELADVNTDGFGYKAVETWDYLEKLGYRFYDIGKHSMLSDPVQRPSSFIIAQDLIAVKETRVLE
jgi:FkbM family methyltransferase